MAIGGGASGLRYGPMNGRLPPDRRVTAGCTKENVQSTRFRRGLSITMVQGRRIGNPRCVLRLRSCCLSGSSQDQNEAFEVRDKLGDTHELHAVMLFIV